MREPQKSRRAPSALPQVRRIAGAAALLVAPLVLVAAPARADHECDPATQICEDGPSQTTPDTVYDPTEFDDTIYEGDSGGTPYDPYSDPANFCNPEYYPDWQSDPYCTADGSTNTTVPTANPSTNTSVATVEAGSTTGQRSAGSATPSSEPAFTEEPLVEVDAADAPIVGAGRYLLAIDALAELGAFERSANPTATALIRDIPAEIPGLGFSDDDYRSEIERFVNDLLPYLDQLEDQGQPVSDALWASMDALEAADSLDESAAFAVLDPVLFLDALADLSAGGDDGRSLRTEQDSDPIDTEVRALLAGFSSSTDPISESEPVAPADGSADDSGQAQDDVVTDAPNVLAAVETTSPSPEEAGSALPLIGAVLVGVIAAAIALIWMLRRRSDPDADASVAATIDLPTSTDSSASSGSRVGLGDLLEASRRMTSSLDVEEIAAIGLTEAKRLVSAEAGIVVRRNGRDLQAVVAEPNELFKPLELGNGSLQRVLETGRSVATIASDEPVLVEVPMAMAAVPIVADGTVSGVLMVVRVPNRPFDRDDLDALEMLAPLIGSAFQAADAHGDATALVDLEPLTGLNNRRRLDQDLSTISPDDQVAYVMLDIDHFKNFNDVNGHSAGDEALRQVAALLEASVRPGDLVYRYGGEEFCVLLPGATAEEAKLVAERARTAIETAPIPGRENQPSGRVTISVGVSDSAFGVPSSLVERADAALYEAKRSGRNQVVVETTESTTDLSS